jgi:hypothetical protein
MSMGVRVVHSIGDLASDLRKIPAQTVKQGNQIIRRNVVAGSRETRRLARRKAGKHGRNYFKRISSEMTGILEGEYGPSAVQGKDYLGAGWRHGENTDLPQSLDLIRPKLHKDVEDMLDGLFWSEK